MRINNGTIVLRPTGAAEYPPDSERTFIVTGIARSGTTLIATLLRQAGIFMGEFLHEAVQEDAQVLEIVRSRDMQALKPLVRARNRGHARWGFKVPNLHAYLRHDELSLFRNPHLIIIYRDPVAVAVRDSLSEHYDEAGAFMRAASANLGMSHFAEQTRCPALLISYEKALSTPAPVVDGLLDFCGIALSDNERSMLLSKVQPNQPEYIAGSSSNFDGTIDGLYDGQLCGWCRQVDRLEPIKLEVYANGVLIANVLADAFRQDLADAGFGNGCHGFVVSLDRPTVQRDPVIRVKIKDRVLDLRNSGMRLSALPVLGRAAPAQGRRKTVPA
ncbi:MAG: hypothetical protein JO227_03350 [Acetobacteraceae bacterium]|nr:hypothetical protein [Acetobacteraceae bacterium]